MKDHNIVLMLQCPKIFYNHINVYVFSFKDKNNAYVCQFSVLGNTVMCFKMANICTVYTSGFRRYMYIKENDLHY